jgi:hypothetical protein
MSTGTLVAPSAAVTTPPPRRGGRLHPAPEPIGERYVRRTRPDGTEYTDVVPLYEIDLLTPEEDDKVMQNPLHVLLMQYLHVALTVLTRGRPGVEVFADCRIDFQIAGMRPLGPDITVVVGATRPYDPSRGTYRVRTCGGRPLLALEVLSDSTWNVDTGPKFGLYHRAGVQHYILIERSADGTYAIEAYYWTEAGFEPMEPDASGAFLLPEVGAGLRATGSRVHVVAADGSPLPDYTELTDIRRQIEGELEFERQRADAERQRADAAEAARQADQTRLAELEAELRRLRGEN